LPTGSGGGGFGGQLADGAANTAELQARNHHSAVPTLISIGEITGVGAQLGNSEIERACGSWSMRNG
jgi:hypothetical protein